ncbi:MAG TPA: methionine/alanine import family NSS transporter small subunit [Egicoccus sp.]|nr:methionine/alanine import family NSS transporter small subunit [Egicoccus sp.]HSK24646.1 methionine/alanine import family NSS transporter small subunit [Egicoccus sp.]
MSTSAIVMMVIALTLVWGGFVASLVFAALRSRGSQAVPGRDT